MNDRPETPLLDTAGTPAELRRLKPAQLRQLADELRAETISAVSVTGGHLGAGLGVVELTVALHHVLDTPRDQLVWDVGHQGYPHKLLTGRGDRDFRGTWHRGSTRHQGRDFSRRRHSR